MLNILKRALLAASSFYSWKSNPLFISQFGGVEVVIYDNQVGLSDALLFAREAGFPLLDLEANVLFDEIKIMGGDEYAMFDGKPSGNISFREVHMERSGNWWSEWQPTSECCHGDSESLKSYKIPFNFSYPFSISEGPLDWKSVSPLLNVNDGKDAHMSDEITVYITPKEKVAQAWCQTQVKWFDAYYKNCTVNTDQESGLVIECGHHSELYHGDAPYRPLSDTFRLRYSMGVDNCNC